MSKYRVSRGGAILGYNQRVFAPGEIVPDGYFTSGKIKEHLKSGYLVSNTRLVVPAEGELILPPGVTEPRALPVELDLTPEGIAKAKAKAATPIVVSQPDEDEDDEDEDEVAVAFGIWSLDPDGLRNMQIEELNVMIQERDSGVTPFDTAAEAVTWLSQDYVEPVEKA